MKDMLEAVLIYGAIGLLGIPVGRVFPAPWLIVLSVLMISVEGYFYYFPGHLFNSPDAGQLATVLPYLWMGISAPILIGAWATWIVRSALDLRKKAG